MKRVKKEMFLRPLGSNEEALSNTTISYLDIFTRIVTIPV